MCRPAIIRIIIAIAHKTASKNRANDGLPHASPQKIYASFNGVRKLVLLRACDTFANLHHRMCVKFKENVCLAYSTGTETFDVDDDDTLLHALQNKTTEHLELTARTVIDPEEVCRVRCVVVLPRHRSEGVPLRRAGAAKGADFVVESRMSVPLLTTAAAVPPGRLPPLPPFPGAECWLGGLSQDPNCCTSF